ncbi:MAG: hypothetical protein AUF65_00890 [Chloroflexi bacterium 13_1_20CM_50_12]|nr:MAG: hypothetical protein AUF65_00890 [Chloroflexi bacterium 13_1_20CM_50_12]
MDEDTIQVDNNLCQQCGGTIRMTYTMGFEGGKALDLRADPSSMLKLCPGHPKQTASSQEEDLSDEQHYSLRILRHRMDEHFTAEISAFYVKHPNLRLDWDFTIDAFPRKLRETKAYGE